MTTMEYSEIIQEAWARSGVFPAKSDELVVPALLPVSAAPDFEALSGFKTPRQDRVVFIMETGLLDGSPWARVKGSFRGAEVIVSEGPLTS